ncbi:UNVERIFIED_ORG: LuxR family transcriptional activator of conjugal transfer of Ti plasmids [Ensifer adhaerens]|nr:LuxR family transcriptional activator of conjugal transfer of Ti plasmids [Ensifer adhaerens]
MRDRQLFIRLSEATAAARCPKSLKQSLGRFARNNGFDGFAYLSLHPIFAVTDYPAEWQRHYFERSYMRLDPVVTGARRVNEAFPWSVDQQRRGACSDLRRFYTEAADFGIQSGVTIPVRAGHKRFSIVTLCTASSKALLSDIELNAVEGAWAGALVHAKFSEVPDEIVTRAEIDLSWQERLCLSWSAEGKTMLEIAMLEGIAKTTVRFYIDKAKKKLGVMTLPQATAKATDLKLI